MAEAHNQKPFVVLFVGEVGMGKSALIKALCKTGKGADKPIAGDAPGGVTKKFNSFPIEIGEGYSNVYAVDCMGVGDKDAKLPDLVVGIEHAMDKKLKEQGLTNAHINAIVVCIKIGGRINVGAQIAAKLLHIGIVNHDKNALNNIVICGTMADDVKERKIKSFREKLAPAFEEYIGGPPVHIVVTGVESEEDPEAENNIQELRNALRAIGNDQDLHYKQPASEEMVDLFVKEIGYEIENPAWFRAELEKARREKDQLMLKHMEELRRLAERQAERPVQREVIVHRGEVHRGAVQRDPEPVVTDFIPGVGFLNRAGGQLMKGLGLKKWW